MSALWWVPLVMATVAVGALYRMTRLVAREVSALPASVAGLTEVRSDLAELESEIESTWRAVQHLDLQ
jgi:hypothetical protein